MLESFKLFKNRYRGYQDRMVKDLMRIFTEIDSEIGASGEPGVALEGSGNVSFSMPADHNPEFMVLASAIVRPSNSYSWGAPITWILLDQADGHGSSFFLSAEGAVNARLQVNYPRVRKVFNVSVTPDETFAANGTIVGPTVDFTNFQAAAYRVRSLPPITLTGTGGGTWTKTGAYVGDWDVTAYSTGTSFNYIGPGYGLDYSGPVIQYVGTNNYRVRQVFSGLGAYNVRFVLVDNATNLDVAAITSADVVVIGLPSVNVPWVIPMNQYSTSDGANNFMGTFTNFWVLGLFEAWMVANAKSSTEITVKWQTNYPSASTYKIYRDTQADFSTQTLIHTGTAGKFEDTGRTAATLYYYKLVAVVSGVDTEVTTFRCKTK